MGGMRDYEVVVLQDCGVMELRDCRVVVVGLGGPDLGSKLVAPTNKNLHYWPFRQQTA